MICIQPRVPERKVLGAEVRTSTFLVAAKLKLENK